MLWCMTLLEMSILEWSGCLKSFGVKEESETSRVMRGGLPKKKTMIVCFWMEVWERLAGFTSQQMETAFWHSRGDHLGSRNERKKTL